MISSRSFATLLLIIGCIAPHTIRHVTSFSATSAMNQQPQRRRTTTTSAPRTQLFGASTVEAPTRPDTDRKTNKRNGNNNDEKDQRRSNDANDNDNGVTNDLEYYIDPSESREMNEPFHILLMGSATYIQPKVTVNYVSSTIQYVLGMPSTDAYELSQFAYDNNMSCLGTWTREECLKYGKQLQNRDVICRVVPYCVGGQRGWQAKDASTSNASGSSEQ